MTHGYPWSALDQTSHSHNSQISTLKDGVKDAKP